MVFLAANLTTVVVILVGCVIELAMNREGLFPSAFMADISVFPIFFVALNKVIASGTSLILVNVIILAAITAMAVIAAIVLSKEEDIKWPGAFILLAADSATIIVPSVMMIK